MAQLPQGEPVSPDGALPPSALAGLGRSPFGLYVHVPFCATRCGYCDFNTYTSVELGAGASPASYLASVRAEIRLARRVLGDGDLPVATVFVGGGTPSLLPAADLVAVLDVVRAEFGLAADAEVSLEANPESVDATALATLRDGGFTRISLGMQSGVEHVLATLDRTHTPGRVAQAVAQARAAGFEQLSLDLIYGTPGESRDDWRRSVEAAMALEPDHLSAYALTVEPGTRLAARVARGELPPPDADDQADKYELVDELASAADLRWYEISNWAAGPQQRCRHNLGYWRGSDWWGIGPGAHGHIGGVRWWNVKHPADYAKRLAAGTSPGAGREVLSDAVRREERVMLETRLSDGLPTQRLLPHERSRLPDLVAEGLVDAAAAAAGRVVLSRRGRLLADGVVVRLLADPPGAASVS